LYQANNPSKPPIKPPIDPYISLPMYPPTIGKANKRIKKIALRLKPFEPNKIKAAKIKPTIQREILL
jgi:hypothetical protein